MPPFWGIKPVCHDRHRTVPEFIVILCDQSGNDIASPFIVIRSFLPVRPYAFKSDLT